MRKTTLKTIVVSVLFAACASGVFGVDAYVSELYRQIDIAFSDKSENTLNNILSKNSTDANYYLLENYTMKKIRRLLLDEDYEFAQKASIVVIDNDLDNTDAIEMYSAISLSLENQKERQREIERKKQEELEKLQVEREKKRVAVDKKYVSSTSASGDAVYTKERHETYTDNFWSFRFGLFNGDYVTESKNSYDSFRYGISGAFTYEYSFDQLTIGIDVDAEATLLPFTNDDKTILANISFVPKIGFGEFGRYCFIRAGFASIVKGENGSESVLSDTLYTPVLGFSWNQIQFGSVNFSGNLDYYIGHLATDNIKAAAGGGINFAIPIADMEKVQLNFNLGLKDILYIKDNGIENRASVILAIGAENVGK